MRPGEINPAVKAKDRLRRYFDARQERYPFIYGWVRVRDAWWCGSDRGDYRVHDDGRIEHLPEEATE